MRKILYLFPLIALSIVFSGCQTKDDALNSYENAKKEVSDISRSANETYTDTVNAIEKVQEAGSAIKKITD